MREKIGYIIVLLVIIMLNVSIYAYEWDKGIKSFTLGMTIEEIENVLFRYYPAMKKVTDHNSVNFYFLKGKDYKNDILYNSDEDVKISQSSDSEKNYAEGKVILKKIFGYKLGLSKWMNGNVVFGVNKELDLKPGIQKDYNPQITYHYRHFPLRKVSSLLKSVELSFFDDRLFQILYEIELSYSKYEVLLRHLNIKYEKVHDKELANRFIDRSGGETEITVTEIANVNVEPEMKSIDDFYDLVYVLYKHQIEDHTYNIRVTYTDTARLADYKEYLRNVKKKVDEQLEKAKYSEIKEF